MGNVTVITGGTSGIGKAIVEKILENARREDIVIVNYGHNENAANEMRNSLDDRVSERVFFVREDLSEYENISSFREKILEITDHVDWLILNTGVGTYQPFEEYTYELWDKVIRTNLSIPAFLIKELSSIIRPFGKILLMASHAGQVPYSSSVVYGVSKAGLMFLGKTLVKVLEKRQISINSVAPGFIETRWQNGRSEESYQRIEGKIAAHRFGTPEEVAELCYAILNNGYLNGSVYEIHGGYGYF